MACKKGGLLIYYGFCKADEKDKMVDDLVKEGSDLGYKLKVRKIVPAGEIAPYKHRFRIEMIVNR